MRKFFVISFALLTLSIICSGQDKKNRAIFPPSGKDKKVEVVKEAESARQDTVAIATATDTLKGSNAAALSEEAVKIQQLNESIIAYQDSLSALRAALKAKEDEYNKLVEDLDFADQCLMALAYNRCIDPFDKEDVETAIGFFDRLHKEETKKEYEGLRKALMEYEYCNNEIHSILDKAQNDPDRAGNPFLANEYKDKYINQLKNSRYYRNYMEKKVEYSLEYLDGIVNEALNLLSQHSSQNIIDLSKLL